VCRRIQWKALCTIGSDDNRSDAVVPGRTASGHRKNPK
jgi:hypothetical protein